MTSDADLSPAQRWLTVGLILLLHLAAAWGLLQVNAVREAVREVAPIFVSWVAPPAPVVPVVQPHPVAPRPPPKPVTKPRPAPPVEAPVLSTQVSAVADLPPAPAPPPDPAPVSTDAAPSVPAPVPTTPALQAPSPRVIPNSAIQYLEPPQILYPPLSMRRSEAGLVVVRAFVGTTGGTPRSVAIETSSGHARLDQAALSAVRLARFRPYAEQGVPVEGWALIPIRFELEK